MVCEDSTSSSDNVCSHAVGSSSLVQLYYHRQSTSVQQQRAPLDEPYRTPYTELLSSMVSTLNVAPDGGHAEIAMVSPPATTEMNLVSAAYVARRTSRGPKQPRRQQEGLVPDSQNAGPGLMMTTHVCSSNSCGGAVLHNRFSVLNVIEEALDLLNDIDDDFYPDWSPPRAQSSSVRESGRMRHSRRDIRDSRLKRHRADHETQD